MARFLCSKYLSSLKPIDAEGEETLRKLGQGEIVAVEIKKPRNVRMHRLYFALVNLVWENIDGDRYPTPATLHAAIKIAAGLRELIELPDGTVGFIPGSISFAKMEQVEFAKFFERVCDLIARHFLPGVTSDELRSEVESMTGASVYGDQRKARRAA